MTKQEFNALFDGHPLFLDGATGSNLQRSGMPVGVCPEAWILEHPDVLLDLQKSFVAAGSKILYAPTFSANRIKLSEYGLADQAGEMNRALVSLSKEAAQGKAYVALDVTMTGRQLAPIGDLPLEELIDVYKEQISYGAEAGADLIVVETMMSLQETRAALIAAKETCDLPVLATLTFEADGRTLFGTDARTAAVVLESLGASAVGANCSTGPAQMEQVIAEMARVSHIPVIAKPNAGLPSLDANGQTVYDLNEKDFAEGLRLLLHAGASILGGCCGTTPAHLSAAISALQNETVPAIEPEEHRYLAGERKTLSFGLSDPFLIVGERINPTGKKKFQQSLKDGSMEMVASFGEEQEACGASVLDVNMGMSGIDEEAMMLRAIDTLTGTVNIPLCIDSSHPEVIEAALRHYPGRALINSISAESAKLDVLLPVAAKYGAMFILLPLSDAGLPKDLDEKKQIIDLIVQKALALGMKKEDIVVDGLVATVGANPKAAIETLETIRYAKDLGLATICGLSNISFGLPERSYLNAAFLTMAIQAGLTMAIANPSQELLVCSAYASDLLLQKEGADLRYIQLMEALGEKREAEGSASTSSGGIRLLGKAKETQAANGAEKLKADVLSGNRDGILADTDAALAEGFAPQALLDDALLPAINEVGELFDQGKYFLPQLIASAEAMKTSIERLEPLLSTGEESDDMPTVVIATVEGDIHDIGKNLVALMLKNYGFRVIDLGKDVPKEQIIEAAEKYHAQVIALSALMTTTMQQMKHVIEYAREKHVDSKVIIGGAVITQDYADEIGADGYSKDAADAVKLTKRLLKMDI